MIADCALIAFYSGPFVPIHYAHLWRVIALAHLINLQPVILLPNTISPHGPQLVAVEVISAYLLCGHTATYHFRQRHPAATSCLSPTMWCRRRAPLAQMPLKVEVEKASALIVVDLDDVIVHVIQEENCRLYELEKLQS